MCAVVRDCLCLNHGFTTIGQLEKALHDLGACCTTSRKMMYVSLPAGTREEQ